MKALALASAVLAACGAAASFKTSDDQAVTLINRPLDRRVDV